MKRKEDFKHDQEKDLERRGNGRVLKGKRKKAKEMGWEIGKVEKDTENWKRIEKKIPKNEGKGGQGNKGPKDNKKSKKELKRREQKWTQKGRTKKDR